MIKILLLTAAIVLSGCAHVGEPIDQQAVDQIIEGKTTKAELIGLLGSPMVVTRSSDSTEVLAWSHVSIGAFGSGFRQQTFTATIDAAGVVKNYSSSVVNPP